MQNAYFFITCNYLGVCVPLANCYFSFTTCVTRKSDKENWKLMPDPDNKKLISHYRRVINGCQQLINSSALKKKKRIPGASLDAKYVLRSCSSGETALTLFCTLDRSRARCICFGLSISHTVFINGIAHVTTD